jgi:hypothetical protein
LEIVQSGYISSITANIFTGNVNKDPSQGVSQMSLQGTLPLLLQELISNHWMSWGRETLDFFS